MKAFQKSHGLNDDGVIGGRTIEEMNVSAEERLKMVLLNLDRMRTESPDMEDRFVFVNIPSTELRVIDNGVTTFHANAIVGKVARKTPLLKSEIFQAKLNPDWSVPAKIARIDMLKHELEEPGYFANKNVRVYTSDGREVDPRAVNWKQVKDGGSFPYRLKQDAGPENALGPMKLDFQNDYAVFIHGTSAPKLFEKQDRFFSSGCVRVDDPLGLATFLIQDDPAWNRARVEEVVKGGKTTYVKLVRPIPLHIVYMTAWIDEQGIANFRNDVYKRDPSVSIPAGLASPTLIAQQESGAALRRQRRPAGQQQVARSEDLPVALTGGGCMNAWRRAMMRPAAAAVRQVVRYRGAPSVGLVRAAVGTDPVRGRDFLRPRGSGARHLRLSRDPAARTAACAAAPRAEGSAGSPRHCRLHAAPSVASGRAGAGTGRAAG